MRGIALALIFMTAPFVILILGPAMVITGGMPIGFILAGATLQTIDADALLTAAAIMVTTAAALLLLPTTRRMPARPDLARCGEAGVVEPDW